MSRGFWALVALVVSSALAQGAFAQSVDEEIDEATGRKIQYQQRTELNIDDPLLLDGTLVGPQIKAWSEPKRKGFNPLFQLRGHWNEEMKASVDEVK